MRHEHSFIKSDKYKGYEVCLDCGTFHSIAQVDPKIIYEDNPYWGENSGRSTLEEQISNLTCIDECGISKVDRILQFIPESMKYSLEIGAAPGVLLKKLSQRSELSIGIEPSKKYIPFILNQSPNSCVIEGYFPACMIGIKNEFFDCIVAMDIFEHVEDYEGFLKEIKRLLIPNGIAVIMSPIIYEDGFLRQRDMEYPDQHCWIFTKEFLEPYLKELFVEVKFSRWVVGHECIILKK